MGPGIVPQPPRCAPTSPKPSPWGEGAPVRTLGRMRGRPCTQPFLVEKRGAPGCRPNGSFLLPRWATRSPPHPSPSVTASPQGEASGLCSPTRKSVPNQGTYMGTETAPPPEQCATTAKTSEWERAAPKPRGGGGHPPATLCVRAFSRESLDPPPGTGREPTLQVWTCAGPNPDHLPGAARCCVPSGGVPPKPPWGAAPRCPPGPGRGPGFLWKKAGGKNTRGKPLDPGFYGRSLPLAGFWGRCL